MTNQDKIYRQIEQLSRRIFELSERINPTISISEANKIQKLKNKLSKEKQKLYDRLHPPDGENQFISDDPDLENIDL